MTVNATALGFGSAEGLVPISLKSSILRSLLLSHTFLTLLVPLVLALFFYSTPRSRHQPIFILNVLTILLALSLGIIADVAGIFGLLFPHDVFPPMIYIAGGIIGIFQSMLVDVILLMRLIVVYPLRQIGGRRFILITLLPILLKVARIINVIIFLHFITNILSEPTSGINPFVAYFTAPYLKIEWTAQIVDNSYASLMFLRTIHGQGVETYVSSGVVIKSTLAYRLRALCRIALSNFVIPTIFSIILLIIDFADVYGSYVGDVAFLNSMVSTCGVIFASVWVGIERRRNSSLDAENWNTNKAVNDVLAVGMRNSESGPQKSTIESMSEELGGAQEYVDLEARHDIALVSTENI